MYGLCPIWPTLKIHEQREMGDYIKTDLRLVPSVFVGSPEV